MSHGDDATSRETTIGPVLERHGPLWVLDLSELPLFHGLSVLSRALGEEVVAQAHSDRIDVTVEREILERENPELLHELGITLVQLCAEHRTIEGIAAHPELFQDHLRALFGTLQRPPYRSALLPTAGAASSALVFTFPGPSSERTYRFVLERVASSGSSGRCFLRITIEDPLGRHLDLESIEHVKVEDLDQRIFIAGSTRIAQTLGAGVTREAERGRRSFVEVRRPFDHTFKQLDKAGLGGFEQVHVSWGDDFVARILEGEPEQLHHLMKRVLLALEDRQVRRLLAEGEILRIDVEDASVHLDTSQLGRVLNLSLGKPRERADLASFLDRMPATSGVVRGSASRPLQGVSVFLIHHITAEILGTIEALRRLGCRDLVCPFVAYSGDAPGSYLAPLLELPPDEFTGLALLNVPEAGRVEGSYRLSTQYSRLEDETGLTEVVAKNSHHYYDAMRATAVFAFLGQLDRARREGRRCLIVEDGGYLAPTLNRACLDGMSANQLLGEIGSSRSLPKDGDRPLTELLGDTLVGSVEHTRNGFNRLALVEEDHGRLAFPAFSIAISGLKIDVESKEVAVSILNAVENVLAATGKILSRRRCLVLGSRGAIGRHLTAALANRLDDPGRQLAGVDLKVETTSGDFTETKSVGELDPAIRNRIDLVLGVTGQSVLEAGFVEEWLQSSDRSELILASGSTKTEEFSGLAAWTEQLLRATQAQIGRRDIQIRASQVTDPITGRLFAHRYTFGGATQDADRSLVFVAKLTPVNFMFYGVPTELIDEVLAELLSVSLGLVARSQREELPRRLHAVDRDIRSDGEPIE